MSIKKEILKHKLSLSCLQDDTLILLFEELDFFRDYDRKLLREIVKELVYRKKLFLLTKRR